MKLTFKIVPDMQLIVLLSLLPFNIPKNKRTEMAIAVSAVNNKIINGAFDYNIITGNLFFKITNSFIDSTIDEEVLDYLFVCSVSTIDDYNDKFFMLTNGMMSFEQFMSSLNE